jgi:3-oxoacyl-[acyl-carrier protein] reductase
VGLTPRVALVTGGGRGIGRGIAERLAAEGHTVIVAARSEAEVEATAQAICATGGSAQGRVLDVTDAPAVEALVREIVTAHGRLEILVNSAGTSYIAPLVLADPDRARAVLETNLLGAWIVSQAVVRSMMAARWGRIIHVGSISAEVGAPFAAIYAASKGGVHALVRSLALELAHAGITVNVVSPGYVHTQLFDHTQGRRADLKGVSREQHEADLLAEVPTGRFVEASDVAAAVAYLASEEARSVTGQVLTVDGGRTAV